jgi:dienelactone hydrolase
VGPNKIFKDIAFGLASRGIAVLRYTKRTHQAGGGLGSIFAPFSLKEELNDDARAAISLLAGRNEIDHRRVYVVGHSMGGIATIQIAANDSNVAGIAVMGTPSEELLTVLLGRVGSMGSEGRPDSETLTKMRNGESVGDVVSLFGQKSPASYLMDVGKFAPGAAAAKLKMPILVMVAGHDSQVPDDLDSWKKALGGHANATVRFYSGLFHLFMPSSATGKGDVPEDWGRPSHVSPEVVEDIASWVVDARR